MSLRIETGGEALDLAPGSSLTLELRSPIWNELGSQTAALTIPSTSRNRRLLGYPERTDRSQHIGRLDAVISDGPLRLCCKLNVCSASRDEMEISLGTDESLMYEEWQDLSLRDIPGLPTMAFQSVDAAAAYMEAVYERTTDDTDFRVFPVALEFQDVDGDADMTEAPEAVIINALKRDDTAKDEDDLLGTSLKWQQRTEAAGLDDDATVTVPNGYGVSPFLRVGRFLDRLFSLYGYSLEENPFTEDTQLAELVMLNNTLDAITTGTVYYSDLLPDCTVNDLLDSLKAHFGAVFYLSSQTRKARCVLIRDTLAATASQDLTNLKTAFPKITTETPQRLVLSSQTSYENASTEQETIEAFLARYRDYIDVEPCHDRPALQMSRFTQSIDRRGTDYDRFEFFSSLYFPWDTKTEGYDEYSVQGRDQLVPLFHYHGGADQQATYIFNFYALPLYLSGSRNSHTTIKASSSLVTDESLDRETDLAFCFAHGKYVTVDGYGMHLFYGSPYPYRPDGTRFEKDGTSYMYSLQYTGEDGAYARFLQAFDSVLRHSNRQIETTMRYTLTDLSRLDHSQRLLFEGQGVLLDTVKLVLPLSRNIQKETTLRTLLPLTPVTDTSALITTITKPLGYWDVTTDRQQIETAIYNDIRNLLEDNYSTVEITSKTFSYGERELVSNIKVPTAQEIASQATKTVTYTVRCRVEYRYKQQNFIYWEKGTGAYESPDATVTETWTATAYSDA